MAIFGKYFEYNGHRSDEFNLQIASFEIIDSYESGMSRDVQAGNMNRYRSTPNHFGTVYSSTLSFQVNFIKDICTNTDMEFTRSEYRTIVDWLTEPEYPSLYHMTDYDNEEWADEEEDYFGLFTNIENISVGEIVGIRATFTCDSPFAWSHEQTLTFDGAGTETITIDADVPYTYPTIHITPNDNNYITISNDTEEMSLTFRSYAPNDDITIDSRLLTIKDITNQIMYLTDVGISDPSAVYWPRFVRGENTITVSGDASFVFTYRTARKVGAY